MKFSDVYSGPKMSEWFPLSQDPPAPKSIGLIMVRATRDGQPIPVEGSINTDEDGTIYIKACDNIWLFVRWLYASLKFRNKLSVLHPAAEAYFGMENAEELYPIDGLQFCYCET